MEVKQGPTMERDFSKVILTLENVLIPDEKLSPTPSMQDGLDSETETDLRILGCEMIQTSGILLKLPQVAMATGQVLFQRFFYSKSFVKHNMEVLAMACVNLASKIEECPRRIRDVINVFHHVKQVRSQKTIHPLVLDQNYINLKNQVIKAERRVLKELGFCVHVKHPHKVIVMYLQVLESEQNRKLVQCAWNYMNDSFRTDVFVRCNPETIACACIYLAARQLQVPLPNNPPWYELFDVEEREIQDICLTILQLYARKKPNADHLEKKVNTARNIQIEAKKRAKEVAASERGTPNSTSRQNSPKNVSPNPTLLGSILRLKKEADKDRHSDRHSDRDSNYKENYVSKKRKNGFSRSRSRSRSRSSRSRSSRSFSPAQKKRKEHSPVRKLKKNKYSQEKYSSNDKYSSKDMHKSRKRKQRSQSRSHSVSVSPERKSSHKKHNKDRTEKYYSPPERHSTKRTKNGQHLSPSRDRYEKYDRYDKYDKYEKHDRYEKVDKYEKYRR